MASALPDAWTVLLVNGTQTISQTGSPITPVLATGITPLPSDLPPGTNPFPAGSPVDAGLQWIVEFDAAVAAGMALKIPLNADQRARGFDRIFVYGLRTGGAGGSTDLGNLFDDHHYTDGFALVPQGSPTKNTSDASSAYSRKDPDYDASFAYERQGPLTQQPNCDGNVFARLIGIDPTHLAHTQYADGINNQSAQDTLTALWPATLGYLLSQMMDPVFQADQIESGREYVAANTMPRGPVPAFRIGTTPYGVLPVTSLKLYKPPRPEQPFELIELGLVNFVSRLWPGWLASSANAPHMQNSGDPDAQLIGLLGMDASSMNFRGRQVLGNDFLWNYMAFLGFPLAAMEAWLADELSPGRLLLDSLNYNTWDPRVIHVGLSGKSFPVSYPTVQSEPLSETDPLKADANIGGGTKVNYIQWLRQASVADLQNQNYPGTSSDVAALHDFTPIAGACLRKSCGTGRGFRRAARGLAIQGSRACRFPAANAAGEPAGRQVGAAGAPLRAKSGFDLGRISRRSYQSPAELTLRPVGRVAGKPRIASRRCRPRNLDRLLTEWLDACSYRLDVWASTVANAILNRTRGSNNIGLHLGALRMARGSSTIAAARQASRVRSLQAVQKLDALRAQRVPNAPVLPMPIQPLIDNGGYIYSPSFEQAAVAAVLRNGYMTHKGTSEEPLLNDRPFFGAGALRALSAARGPARAELERAAGLPVRSGPG